MALREAATYEEVRKMTGHTTNKAFDRYLRLEGSNMKALYSRRQTVLDNELITEKTPFPEGQIIVFTK
jgi:hypothetical protein